MSDDLQVMAQRTPNPNSMKFTLNRTVSDESRYFNEPDEADGVPLAEALFEVDGVTGVFLLNNFVTIDKDDGTSWNDLAPRVEERIRAFYSE